MVGSKRVVGLSRAFAPGAVACLVLGVGACGVGTDAEAFPPAGASRAGNGGFAGAGAADGFSTPPEPSTGGGFGHSSGPAFSPGGAPCQLDPVPDPVFSKQRFDTALPARGELYSWTTDEQLAALRKDQVLFTQSERPGMGPGYAMIYLQQLAQGTLDTQQAQLAGILGGELFAKARYAWSEPWATRMGWPGEDYGNNLIRIVLKPEALVVVVAGGGLSVFDMNDMPVALADAIANPQRLGAIFYWKDASAGGPSDDGSFQSGSNGYREFIVGNLDMVEEWSVATQVIRDRLSANIQSLTDFLARSRSCPVTTSAEQWNRNVVSSWLAGGALPPLSEVAAYEQALAIPSSNYLAVPDRIATIIDTLQGDLFEPDPLVVTPGSP